MKFFGFFFLKKRNMTFTFNVEVPPGMNDSSVSYSAVRRRGDFRWRMTPYKVITTNKIWVSGAFFVATAPVMKRYVTEYRTAVRDLLAMGLSSTDQQVIGALHTGQLAHKPRVSIQEHQCPRGHVGHVWFCLPYKCKEAAEQRDRDCPCHTCRPTDY